MLESCFPQTSLSSDLVYQMEVFYNFMSFVDPILCVSCIYYDGYNQALLKQEEEKNKDDIRFDYKLLDEENQVPHLSKC